MVSFRSRDQVSKVIRYLEKSNEIIASLHRIRFNTKRGSIVGQIEGEKDKIDQMAMWLKLQGKFQIATFVEEISRFKQNQLTIAQPF